MSFSRTNIWSAGSKFTAAQVNQIDTNITNCFDIRTGQSNHVSSSNFYSMPIVFNSNMTTSGTTNFHGNVNIAGNLQYLTQPTRYQFIPAIQMTPFAHGYYAGILEQYTNSSENYVAYHKVYYNSSYKNQYVKFTLPMDSIPNGALISNVDFYWTPINHTANPSDSSEYIKFHLYRSLPINSNVINGDPATSPNQLADIHQEVEASRGGNWIGSVDNDTVTMLFSPELTHQKRGEQYSIGLELLAKSDAASTAAILFYGVTIAYKESLIGVP